MQMRFAPNDYMIEEFTPDRSDHAFDIAVLPRRVRRDRAVPNAQALYALFELIAEFAVIVSN